MTRKQNLMDPDVGRAAYEALKPMLDALTNIRRITADVQKVAIAAAAVARKINGDPAIRARFERQPAEDFDIAHLDRLEQVALATIYTSLQYRRAAPAATKAKLSVEVLEQATTLRQRMIKVLDYNVGDRPDIARRLENIRQGTGYRDLAEDLWRLAELYLELAAELAADRRLYRAGDRDDAHRLVQRIHMELGEDKNDEAARWADAMQRAWTLLLDTYDEVSAAGRWLYRHEDPNAVVPSPFVAARGTRRPNNEPDDEPDDDTDGEAMTETGDGEPEPA